MKLQIMLAKEERQACSVVYEQIACPSPRSNPEHALRRIVDAVDHTHKRRVDQYRLQAGRFYQHAASVGGGVISPT
jgi:hypothetical protein